MGLSINHETEQCINHYLENGQFKSADDVILAGLKLLQQRQQRLSELRQQVEIGSAQIAAGQVIDGEVFLDSLLGRIKPQ